MKIIGTLLMASVLASGLLSPAIAADVVVPPTVVATPTITTFPGRSVDIIGIAPGMKIADAQEILKDKYQGSKISIENINMGFQYKGINVRLDNFNGEYFVYDDTGSMKLIVSSPTTDSRVMSMIRTVDYKDLFKAPTIESTISALKEKYGAPSLVSRSEKFMRMEWLINNKGDFVCPAGVSTKIQYCPVDTMTDRVDQNRVKKAINNGFKVGISVAIHSDVGSDKVKSMSVTVEDFSIHWLELTSIDTLLRSVVDKGLSSTSSAKPSL